MATTSEPKPHFLTLPPEIREQVYSLIFEPETYRRHEEDEYVTYHYAKAFVLFKINRQIYNEAHKVFYDLNTFVRIETPWPQSKEHVMAEGHVPIIIQNEYAKRFKNYRLDVGIDAPAYISPEVETECFIIHIDDVSKFTRSWFYADLSHPSLNPNLRLSLRLNDPFSPAGRKHIPPALQRRLLLPWAEVKNLSQMKLGGDPEPGPKIASELKALLAKPLPSPEHCLGECARLKREGNTALQTGRYREALDTYKKAWEAIHITIFGRNRHVHGDAFYNVRLREAPYEGKVGQAERLILRVQLVANTCLVYLKMESYEECIFWGMRTINTVRIGMGLDPDEDRDPQAEAIPGFLAATEMGKIYFRTALAYKAIDEKSEARKLARVAMEYLPGAGDQKALQQLLRDYGTSFYGILELGSDDEGDRTDDQVHDEYEDMDTLDGGDDFTHEDSDALPVLFNSEAKTEIDNNFYSLGINSSLRTKSHTTTACGRTERRAVTYNVAAMQLYNARSSVITRNGGTTHVGPYTPLRIAINTITRGLLGIPTVPMDDDAIIIGLARISTTIPGDTPTTAPQASEENTVHITDTTTIASSPFPRLPGELRNRIYRLYFEDFEEQMSRRFPYNKSKMTPNFLALMHTNRMIRSEAASVFYKEIVPFHSFTCPIDQPIEGVMLTRIRDVCSLISIRDAHMSISVRCAPSWKDHRQAGYNGDDAWRRREIKAFASCALVQVSYTARPPRLTRDEAVEWIQGVHASWSGCASDHTNEARTTTGFVVKYRDEGKRETENFVHIEGSLAEVNWNRGWHF